MPGAGSFGIECLSGGKFYANNATAFLGCCTFDPATAADSLCTDAGLRPMTFDPDAYDKIPVQECAARSSSLWYSCKGTTPPFLGCCTHNPCIVGTCNKPSLGAAMLSSNERLASLFLEGVSDTTTTSTASSSTTTTAPTKTTVAESSTTTPVSTTTPSSTAAPTPSMTAAAGGGSGGSQGVQPAVVAGMVIGIAAAAVAIALLVVWWMRRRRVAAKEKALTVAGNSPIRPGKDGTTTPWTPAWLNSPVASPPDYSTLSRGEKTVYAAELPGNVCFELPGESAKSPQGR
ncbi:hypothetical protein NHJ13734_003424 [Beauveria thailandica]